jgi:hypothetical protein
MAKLNQIIQDLNSEDYENIFKSLIEGSAEKSAYLFKHLKEGQLKDHEIMVDLKVNANAYYTLRSRLNQRIEEYLLQKMESPRADLLKKVANIHEIIFTQKKAIAIATLRKLEKELLDYDLSNELTIVYKYLKKLHINSDEHYNYRQLYNQQVAFNLAIDKEEDDLGEYFKKFGEYYLTRRETLELELSLLAQNLENAKSLYKSHRLYVYRNCQDIFSKLFFEKDTNLDELKESFEKLEVIFETYYLDSTYFHLKSLLETIKFEVELRQGNLEEVEKYAIEVETLLPRLIQNYQSYTFPSIFLFSFMHWKVMLGEESSLAAWNEENFGDFDPDPNNIPGFVTYSSYRSIASIMAGDLDKSSQFLNNLLNEISFKGYPEAHMEVKILLATIYTLMDDFELFSQLAHSIQRQIRIMGKGQCMHGVYLIKLLKTKFASGKKNKGQKLQEYFELVKSNIPRHFSPAEILLKTGYFEKLILEPT